MNNFEEPVMPPEGKGTRGRFESADLNIEELESFLRDTKFENEEAVAAVLTDTYSIARDESVDEIKIGMTNLLSVEGVKRVVRGEKVDSDEFMQPLSGHDPRALLRMTIDTVDGKKLDLRIFEVFNRNQKFKFVYILKPVEELDKEI